VVNGATDCYAHLCVPRFSVIRFWNCCEYKGVNWYLLLPR